MRKLLLIAFTVFAATVSVAAQTIAITNAKVYPVSSPPIDNATVLIRDGAIVAVGTNVRIPANATRIDATGKVVTPGFIHSTTELGLVEVDQVRSTNDVTARGENNIAASFKVWEGLNPASTSFEPTRNEGVTTTAILPQGGLISGQGAVIDLVSGRTADMVRRAPVAMIAQLDNPNAAGTNARGELIGKLRTLLDDVKFYMQHRIDYERAATRTLTAKRDDLEALIPVVEGRMLLIIDANRVDEIDAAIDLAREYRLRIAISSGAEAWLCADRLAAARVPVLVGAMNNIPGSFATLNQRQENAALLRRAGVTVVLVTNGDGGDSRFNARNIKYEAGNAVAYGMSHDDALRAITLAPAELFGVSERIGSLQAERDANIVVWSGDPFEFSTRVEHVFIRGREVKEPSRQDMLTDRYKPKTK
jgi:imidazolonepropionase-like amidohydrolase